jgi:hypothetical protein
MISVHFASKKQKLCNIFFGATLRCKMYGAVVPKNSKKVRMGLILSLIYLRHFIKRFDIMELELMVVVARKIWFRRNGVVHGEAFLHHQQVF